MIVILRGERVMSWSKGHGMENVSGCSARRGTGGVNTANKGDIERGGPGDGRGLRHQRGLRGSQGEAGGGRGESGGRGLSGLM